MNLLKTSIHFFVSFIFLTVIVGLLGSILSINSVISVFIFLCKKSIASFFPYKELNNLE